MPIIPDESYTEIEIGITKQIKRDDDLNCYDLYRNSKENSALINAVRDVKMLTFSLKSEGNLVGEIEGVVTMRDLAGLERSLQNEKITQCLTVGGIHYGIAKLAIAHANERREDAFILNPCHFDQLSREITDEEFERGFKDLTLHYPHMDPFKKKYIVVPIWTRMESAVMLIVNPMSAMEPLQDENKDEARIYWISTAERDEWKEIYLLKIGKIMQMYRNVFDEEEYVKFAWEDIVVEDIILPRMGFAERPIQLLWTFERFVRLDDMEYHYYFLKDIPKVKVRTMLNEMEKIRTDLAKELVKDIRAAKDKTADYLLERREVIKVWERRNPKECDLSFIERDYPPRVAYHF